MWTQGPVWQPTGGPAVVPPPWTASTATSVGPPPPTPSPTPAPALAPGFSWTGSMNTKAERRGRACSATSVSSSSTAATSSPVPAPRRPPSCTTRRRGTFSPTGSLTAARSGQTATLLRDGRVLVAGGGYCGDAEHSGIWASAELYDPATGTFSPTGSMSKPREAHTATLLADGRVLITGGITGQSPAASLPVRACVVPDGQPTSADVLASAELYDPATGRFSKTGSMSVFRDQHTATLLKDGRVLVVGGGGEGYDSRTEVELYDPGTGRFSRTGSLKRGRWLHTATLLDDGRVLIAGGRSPSGSVYAAAELYDPATGKFSSAGSMSEGRQQHTATLLADGRVLIAGGYSSDGSRWNVLVIDGHVRPRDREVHPGRLDGRRAHGPDRDGTERWPRPHRGRSWDRKRGPCRSHLGCALSAVGLDEAKTGTFGPASSGGLPPSAIDRPSHTETEGEPCPRSPDRTNPAWIQVRGLTSP